jgi:hypothetical protein
MEPVSLQLDCGVCVVRDWRATDGSPDQDAVLYARIR